MEKPSRTLEITVLSGEDLRINRRSVKKNAFVTVRSEIASDHQTTAIDADGGSFPMWNEKLAVDASVHTPNLIVEVRCKTASGEKLVGAVRVPAADFSGGYIPDGYLNFLSYRLRDSNGERNGVINISVRTKVPLVAAGYTCSTAAEWTTVGLPAGDNCLGGSVVTGVPVWLSHRNNAKNF